MQSEETDALRLFNANWLVIGLIALALVVTMALTGFSVKPAGLLVPILTAGVYLAAAYYNAHRGEKRDPLVIFILGSTGQVLVIAMLIGPMTYVAASANFPFQDANLAAIDRALGLDWWHYYAIMTGNENIVSAAIFAYSMIRWPVFGIPVALGFARRYRRLQEFTLALALSLIVTTAASAVLPAIGVYSEAMLTASDAAFQSPAYVEYLHQIAAVRNGGLRELDLMQLAGIVTFPSFHAASAVIFLWALWSVWWMRPIAAITMGAMLVVTPFVGGHYFTDIIAGIAVAVISIAAARWIGRWILARKPQQKATAAPVAVAAGASLAEASTERV